MKLEPADIAGLAPLIAEVVRATVAEVMAADAKLPSGAIGMTEAQAAAAMGIPQHRLRDARLRGEIHARKIGKGYIYGRQELASWLAETD